MQICEVSYIIAEKQRGLTLVEVLVTIAVLGILAGIAVPQISRTIALRELDNASRQLAGDIRLLEQMTLNSNDGSNGVGGILVPNIVFFQGPPAGYTFYKNDKSKEIKHFPSSVTLNGTPSQLSASVYDGKVNSETIGLSSNKVPGVSRFIKIEFMTGRVRVDDHI